MEVFHIFQAKAAMKSLNILHINEQIRNWQLCSLQKSNSWIGIRPTTSQLKYRVCYQINKISRYISRCQENCNLAWQRWLLIDCRSLGIHRCFPIILCLLSSNIKKRIYSVCLKCHDLMSTFILYNCLFPYIRFSVIF